MTDGTTDYQKTGTMEKLSSQKATYFEGCKTGWQNMGDERIWLI